MDDAHISRHRGAQRYVCDQYPEARKIQLLYGDSAMVDYSRFTQRVAFVFIDGAHSYEYVRQDRLSALSCRHGGSVIAWHDYGRSGVNGVSRWVDELSRDYEIYSVSGGSLAFTVPR